MMNKLKSLLVFIIVLFWGCATQTQQVQFSKSQSITQTQEVLSPALTDPKVKEVGFDIDDTVLFSSPAFERGFASGNPYGSDEFWAIVNSSDKEVSKIKQKTRKIIEEHLKRGHKVYFITARRDVEGEKLKEFLSRELGIPKQNIFFAPHGKTQLIKQLGIDAFYGDSDSDMRYAIEAGAMPIGILRNPKSSYKRSYNPGSFDEFIIPDSEE